MEYNLEENAFKIAEYLGYYYDECYKRFVREIPFLATIGLKINTKEELEEIYSSYNGLMPLIFECNSGKDFLITFEQGYVRLREYLREEPSVPMVFFYKKGIQDSFIEAIQKIIIWMFELKGSRS